MADLSPEYRGPKIFGYLGVSEESYVSEERMNEIAEKIRSSLNAS